MSTQIRVPGAPDLLSARFHHNIEVLDVGVVLQLDVRHYSRDRARVLLQQHLDNPAHCPERGTDWILLGVKTRRPIHILLDHWLMRCEFVFAVTRVLDGTIEEKGSTVLEQISQLAARLDDEFFDLLPRDIATGEEESLRIASFGAVRIQILAAVQPDWLPRLRAYYDEVARSSGKNGYCSVLEQAAEDARAPRNSNLPKWTGLPH